MEALLTSIAVVSLAEIGDKTMLLAIVLAAKFRKPWQIIAGIFAATIVNHAFAALIGSEVSGLIDAPWFRIAVAVGFIAMGLWTLVPDKFDGDDGIKQRGSVFLTTLVAFFSSRWATRPRSRRSRWGRSSTRLSPSRQAPRSA
jgi:putative Ca2+/H+ antiporter (TMEM165/GDT1 family)